MRKANTKNYCYLACSNISSPCQRYGSCGKYCQGTVNQFKYQSSETSGKRGGITMAWQGALQHAKRTTHEKLLLPNPVPRKQSTKL